MIRRYIPNALDSAERGKIRNAGWEVTRVSVHDPAVDVMGQRSSPVKGQPLAIKNPLQPNRRRGVRLWDTYFLCVREKLVLEIDGVVGDDVWPELKKNRRFLAEVPPWGSRERKGVES